MSNTNNTMQTQTSNALHNVIMEAGGKDRPPMLAPGNYVQWKSRIKRYIDTKPNHELIHYCLRNSPYEYKWTDKAVLVAEGISETTTERAQVDQESQIKMIQVREMMQDKDLKNSKSKDEGSRSRSQSMNDQIHYKQAKTKTKINKAKHKRQKSYLQQRGRQ
uniref:Uncharacterized protein n=1 Tax=Tanacetum cinerariifolium TaxID=118510 RepID=A0A6L2KAC0_TANCI|nr:hypothetical protein [Tanacetum cinerariifolium]